MTVDLLARAQAGDGDAFGQLVDPYRRELQVHCYRFLGSVAGRRGRAARHLAVGLAGPGRVRGTRLGPDLAVPGRHQPVPGRAAIGSPAPAGEPRRRPGWNRPSRPGWARCSGSSPTRTSCSRGSPTPHPAPRPGTRPWNRSRWPSSPPCSCCRPASAPPSSCATCWDSMPARPPGSWTPARSR